MTEKTTRNYGIDILRILAMYFVVVLHICNQGGVEASAGDILRQGVCFLYKTLTCTAVNIFAIISGYVGYTKTKLKLSSLIELWMVVVFYGVTISIAMIFTGAPDVGYKDILKACLPITLKRHWYFSAYAGLYFFMPLINKLIQQLSAEHFGKTVIVAICVYSVYGLVSAYFGDPFDFKSGYTLIWLAVLYYIGAGLRKFNVESRIPQGKLVRSILCIWGASMSFLLILKYITGETGIAVYATVAERIFLSYVSPMVLMLALAIFLLLAKRNVSNVPPRALQMCSASAFSVYLIHTNPLIDAFYFSDAFCFVAERSMIEMLLYIPAIGLAVFGVCVIIDFARVKLFAFVKIHVLARKIERTVNILLEKLLNKWGRKYGLSAE